MGDKWWILAPLYWVLAALPLMAALWVYLEMPAMIQVTAEHSVPSGRAGVWALPALNAGFAVLLHITAGRVLRNLERRFRELGKKSDAVVVIPAVKVFTVAQLGAICLCVVYGHYVMDLGGVTIGLIGRVLALLPGIGTALFAIGLNRATKDNLLALHWVYTEKSQQVWLKTHRLGAKLLYAAGALMVLAAFVSEGLVAVLAAALILAAAFFALYLYARRMYEDEFFR